MAELQLGDTDVLTGKEEILRVHVDSTIVSTRPNPCLSHLLFLDLPARTSELFLTSTSSFLREQLSEIVTSTPS